MPRFISSALVLIALLPTMLSGAVTWRKILEQPEAWYTGDEARALAANVVLYQTPEGGWPKNRDMTLPPEAHRDSKESPAPTIDNDATYTQLRLIARVLAAKHDTALRAAFDRGIDYLLAAQYANGGWPQFYPLIEGYYTHITFNDDAIVGVLELLRDVAAGQAPFAFVDDTRRTRAAVAVEKGIDCILRCQIRYDGQLTTWCAQHDEVTFAPVPARKYEHTTLSGFESVGIIQFLMSIDHPTPEIITSIKAAVQWFEQVKINGIRIEQPAASALPHGYDRVVVADPKAPSIWARFYEIGTNRPVFSGRDNVIRYNLAEIEAERRGGYRWYGKEPTKMLQDEYPRWLEKHGATPTEQVLVVAGDGSGQYTSVQEAISAALLRTGKNDLATLIRVKPGTYHERIYVQRERGNITVVGEDAATTIIAFDLNANLPGTDGKPIGTFRTPTVQIDGDGMTWKNITFANTAGPVGQALALRADGDRLSFIGCRFLGWQDTILLNRGRHYFADCYIEGHVDFIFGGATAYFERCQIHCLKNGYITAASTPEGTAHGFVFVDCSITGAEGVQTYLGRPWRDFARTIFIRTEMSGVVRSEGWHNWNKPQAEKSAFYAEFASFGPGAVGAGRVAWAKKLLSGAPALFTSALVLAGTDGWNPDSRPTLHLVGDSTMADKPDTDHPERGWGQMLRERMNRSWRLVNHAVNGRSTKSFRDLGHWQNVLNQLRAGDWVVIQFGHNDGKLDDPARYTDPATDYPANLKRYIKEIRDHGAHPVIATSVVRRNWSPDGVLLDSHGAYLTAARAVASEENVPLLEMEGVTRALLTKLGPKVFAKLFLIYAPGENLAFPEGKTDNTHFNEQGARLVAGLAVDEFKHLGLQPAEAFATVRSAGLSGAAQ